MIKKKQYVGAGALVIVLALAWAWQRGRGIDASGGGASSVTGSVVAAKPSQGASAPPVSVGVVRVRQTDFAVRLDATGSVTALNSVDVRAQVSSTITQVHVREGDFVKAGQPLFTLDSRADAANVMKAKAQLQKDKAALDDAERQLARTKNLFAQNFVSQVAVDTNQTLVESQRAVIAADQAAIEAANVAYSYARIVAPSSGRAGAINVYAGSYVTPANVALVTITQLDPVAVSFNLPQRDLPDALASLRNGGGSVQAVLPEGRGTLVGRLQFVDNAVDASSGTVKVKAVFDNAGLQLWPGAFVNVRMAVRTLHDAMVVPVAAIVQNAGGTVLFVVDDRQKASMRPVAIVHSSGTEAVVSGVEAGERVVVEGRQNLRDGTTVVVRPNEVSGAASGAASGSPSGPATKPGKLP